MKSRKPRTWRTDPLVREADRRCWHISEPTRVGNGRWYYGYTETPFGLDNIGGSGWVRTKAQAWAMLRVCLKVALGRGRR